MKAGDTVLWHGAEESDKHRALWGSLILLTFVGDGQYRGTIVSGNDHAFIPGHPIKGELRNLAPLNNKMAKDMLKK